MYICNTNAKLHIMIIQRSITAHLKQMLTQFPVISLTGPRQSGKTTLLRAAFPDYQYYNLERMDYRQLIMADPVGFLKDKGTKIIFDEVQHAPELFSYLQVFSDERNESGQYILSGSQSFLLNERISQSLAGRVHINHLFPFDINEIQFFGETNWQQLIVKGFYPGIYDRGIAPGHFYPSYIQTYVDRDVRSLKNIGDLATFSRFLRLCAGRTGQVLNLSSLANDAGVAVNTAKSWLSLLQASFIVYLVQPYYKNFSKRIIKAPKLYFYDMGIVASLLNIQQSSDINNHYLQGALFENLIISELIKVKYHLGGNPQLYYWRESNGTEVDCLIELPGQKLLAIEIKAGQTFHKEYLKNLKTFSKGMQNIKNVLVYGGSESMDLTNFSIIPWSDFHNKVTGLIEDDTL